MIRWILQKRTSATAARRTCRHMAWLNQTRRDMKRPPNQWLTVRYNPDWTERAAVDEIIREEKGKC